MQYAYNMSCGIDHAFIYITCDARQPRIYKSDIYLRQVTGTVVGKSKYLSSGIQEQLPHETVGCAA